MVTENFLFLGLGLVGRDWEEAAFCSSLLQCLLGQFPQARALVPYGAELPEPYAGRIVRCQPAALTTGIIAEPIAALVAELGAARCIAIGALPAALAQALALRGLEPLVRTRAQALADPTAPPPLPLAAPLPDRAAARLLVDAPEDRAIELIFPDCGAPLAIAVLARIAGLPPAERPLLVLAEPWPDYAILQQHAQQMGIASDCRFCGIVPDALRGALVAAADLVHTRPGAGGYCGEAGRLDAARGPGNFGDAPAWLDWMLRGPSAQSRPVAAAPSGPSSGVAVFLPSWRCREWLPQALSSLLIQSHRERHIFVCADGGEDLDTELLAQFPEVSFLATRQPVGPYAIANLLAAISQSDCIAFHDADDFSEAERFSRQLAELNRLALDMIGSDSRVIGLTGELIGVEARPRDASTALKASGIDVLLHPTSLMRRSLFAALGGFDSETIFGADTEFHFRAALGHALGNVPEQLYIRRERPQSLTRSPETGFGTAARRAYADPVRANFVSCLKQGTLTAPGQTLRGTTIPMVEIGQVRLVRGGRGCEPWLAQSAARMPS